MAISGDGFAAQVVGTRLMTIHKINDKAVSWTPPEDIEPATLQQVRNISTLPFVDPHVAVMPDCHLGSGATVGSVIPTHGAIIPAAVGGDIGCGMIAARTALTREDMPDDLSEIRKAIEKQLPLSAGRYNGRIKKTARPRIESLEEMAGDRLGFYDGLSSRKRSGWRNQLGSLGSGNHFIEVVSDENGGIWAFLHSGSRGIGNLIARYHIQNAKDWMKRWFIELPDADLAYLIESTEDFEEYIRDLGWAQRFALLNREEMMDRVVKILQYRFENMRIEETIQCHHNFTRKENHFGKNLWVTRKGAISAREGEYGLIPGSMGTASYVVVGKGDRDSLCSAPHGAGRRLSRGGARRAFTMEDFDTAMEGIEVRRTEAFLDELPRAYKDIDKVMAEAMPLVEIRQKFGQIINVKGE